MAGTAMIKRVTTAVLLAGLMALPACTHGKRATPAAAHRTKVAPPNVTVTPARGAVNQPVTTEIGTTVSGGQVISVAVTGRSGQPLGGTMRPDGSSWVPDAPLEYSSPYTATVKASGPGGTTTRTVSFTTMANPGSSRIGTGMYLFNGEVYGVGLPLAIEFDEEIPESGRAAVERRLFVSSTPEQVGAWHWYGGRQVIYRPRTYWEPGTRIALRAALGGLPVGNRFIDSDRGATVTIGDKVEMVVQNATKQMIVYHNNVAVRSIPVSLGKPSTPSSSGRMVIMSKAYQTIFDTTREGPGGYRVSVNYAMRLTWGGEFVHAAPWSVGDQGVRNVSHGCVNMSTGNAAWLFGLAHVGDPITVTGTGIPLTPGNGWTSWDMPWDRYVAGSALPATRQQATVAPNARPGY